MIIFQLDLLTQLAEIKRIGNELRFLYIEPRLESSNGFGSSLKSGKLFTNNDTDEPLVFNAFNQKIRESSVNKNLILNMSNSSLLLKVNFKTFILTIYLFEEKII